ncbi:MAG: hypothetical protein IJP30_04630 [Clostridia bacterium]|nr:hypothetical protein [Clostridia bacterium]
MTAYKRDPRLDRFVTFAAEGQEAEMAILNAMLETSETVEAAASTMYQNERGLLAVTNRRVLMIYRDKTPPVALQVPIGEIVKTYPSMWYMAGNLTLYTVDTQYYFALMSQEVYIPISQTVERLAQAARDEEEA